MEFLDHKVYKLKTLITIVRLPLKHLLSSVLLPAVLITFPRTVVYTGYYETYIFINLANAKNIALVRVSSLVNEIEHIFTQFLAIPFFFVNFPFISLVHFYSLFVLLIYELTKAAHSFWVLDPNPLHASNRQFSGQQLSVPQFIFNLATIHPETASESTGSGLSPRRPPPPRPQLQILVRSSGSPVFRTISYKLEVPTISSLGSINLQERLTKLREGFYSLDHSCIMEAHSSGIAGWKSYIGRGMGGKPQSFQAFSEHATLPKFLRVHQPESSPNPFL